MTYVEGEPPAGSAARERWLHPGRSLADPTAWLGLLVAARLADAVTTAAGAAAVDTLVEGNPVPAAVMGALGVPTGLAVLTVASVGIVALVTEAGVRSLGRRGVDDRRTVVLMRALGYGPLSVVSVGAALHNAVLLGRVLVGG